MEEQKQAVFNHAKLKECRPTNIYRDVQFFLTFPEMFLPLFT